MTVSYTGDVANGSRFGIFWTILLRWKGSVYKLIWRELIAYLIVYFLINIVYRFGMGPEQKLIFERVKVYCRQQIESIPMSFVLGFYVSLIVKRWWDQYWILPLPDSLALYINAGLHGQDERSRLLRRTIMRYTMLSYIITLQRISFRVKKRFPTLQHLVDTGFMMESEKKVLDQLDSKSTVSKFWVPVVWASNLITRAKNEGRIPSDHMLQTIIEELSDFRRRLGRVMVYDTVSVPLVYTQVVTLAVYTYFIAALIGKQWVNPADPDSRKSIYPGYELDLVFPIFLSLQFIFYIGWLKVAETLINPFGEDDDDFEINWLIDRHLQVSYMVVDEIHEEHPELLKDTYWDQVVPTDLPYNGASEHYRRNEPLGSTASMKIKQADGEYANLTSVKRHSAIPDDVYGDYAVVDSPANGQRKSLSFMQRVQSFRSTSSSSSFFNRSKSQIRNGDTQPAVNGVPLPNRALFPWTRRSSKDRNSQKNNNNNNNASGRFLAPKAMTPGNRPRVPTPDVSKDTGITLSGDKAYSTRHGSQLIVPTTHRPGPPAVANSYNMNYLNNAQSSYEAAANYTSANSYQRKPAEVNGNYPTRNLPPVVLRGSEDIYTHESKRGTKSPLPFDGDQQQGLTTIEENDGSPHSTCSTTRSLKSSTYPTTTSIFGNFAPPVPEPNSGQTSPLKEILETNKNHDGPSSASTGYNSDTNEEGDVDDADQPYMTISEVKESCVKFGSNIRLNNEQVLSKPDFQAGNDQLVKDNDKKLNTAALQQNENSSKEPIPLPPLIDLKYSTPSKTAASNKDQTNAQRLLTSSKIGADPTVERTQLPSHVSDTSDEKENAAPAQEPSPQILVTMDGQLSGTNGSSSSAGKPVTDAPMEVFV